MKLEKKTLFQKKQLNKLKNILCFNDNSKDEDFIITTKGNPLKTQIVQHFIAKVNSLFKRVLDIGILLSFRAEY